MYNISVPVLTFHGRVRMAGLSRAGRPYHQVVGTIMLSVMHVAQHPGDDLRMLWSRCRWWPARRDWLKISAPMVFHG